MDWVALSSVAGSAATGLGSVATAVMVFYTKRQLKAAHDQARTAFEDNLEREYRQIAAAIPVRVLLGAELDAPLSDEVLAAFHRYIDLTNQQVFLRSQERVTPETWRNWRDGISHHLSRPGFRAAWKQIGKPARDDFWELRRLEESGFRDDPADWSKSPPWQPGGRADGPAAMPRVA